MEDVFGYELIGGEVCSDVFDVHGGGEATDDYDNGLVRDGCVGGERVFFFSQPVHHSLPLCCGVDCYSKAAGAM